MARLPVQAIVVVAPDESRAVAIGSNASNYLVGDFATISMFGGDGLDRYVVEDDVVSGIINDSDGSGYVVHGAKKIALGVKLSEGEWVGTDGLTFTKLATAQNDLQISFDGGATNTLTVENFNYEIASADYLGIRLIDAPSAPTNAVRTFLGDTQDWDSDPNQSGVQTQLDAYGNTIRADGQGDPIRPDLLEGDRDDFFYGSDAVEVEHFVTAGGNDTVYADGAASTTSTVGGDDIVEAGAGSDVVAGGAGDDWLEGGTEDDILGGNEGNDSLFAESSNAGALTIDLAIAQGEAGMQRAGQGDLLSGDAGDDVLFSDAGADYLAGGVGEDIIIGGAGDDTIYGDGSVFAATLGWSVERTRADVGSTSTFTVSPTGIVLINDDALGGLDIIYGGAGDDWIFAGAGDDYVEGGIGDDVLFGEAGNDVLIGGNGNDFLSGDSSSVDAAGLSGDDYLVGGAGDDELVGGKGNDYLDGGDGFDRLSGGDGDDTLAGGPGIDVLVGGAGKDTYIFNAGDGTEIIDDTPSGPDDPEASVLVLGPGISPADVKFRPGSLIVDVGNGDTIQFLGFDLEDPLSTPVLDSIEFQSGGFMTLDDVLEQGFDIDGTEGDDALFGTPYTDRIDAKGGDDTVTGRAGDDTILGGAGDDWIEADDGNDVVDGGEGSDQIAGGWGDDTLQG
ncbi:MAG: calcium-binding protein, partial [Gemmatimonadaceae bacterium]